VCPGLEPGLWTFTPTVLPYTNTNQSILVVSGCFSPVSHPCYTEVRVPDIRHLSPGKKIGYLDTPWIFGLTAHCLLTLLGIQLSLQESNLS
jgi:hypothetical protein